MDFDWRVTPFTTVRDFARSLPPRAVLAVDGRSAGGKTSFARRLAAAIDGACVVHTDDIAWNHGVLNWDGLLRDGVLRPFRAGRAVSYRPPQYDIRGRSGAIEVPAACSLLIVEGVGSGRRDLAGDYDAVVWVETGLKLTETRDEVRLAAGETTPADYASWMAEENPFQQTQRTWEHADLVIAGYPAVPYDPASEVLVASQPARR
jgi:hypothetical protein